MFSTLCAAGAVGPPKSANECLANSKRTVRRCKMDNVIIYLRVSTAQQGRSGLGLDAQRQQCQSFAQQHNLTVLYETVEVETGKGSNALERRPILRQAMREARRQKAQILVAKLDRLSRDVHFISGLMAQRVPFLCADLGYDVDPFMLHVYAAVSEKERALIGQRTREALRAAKARGVLLGNRTNIGDARALAAQSNRDAGKARRDAVMPLIDALRARDIVSYAGIARALNEQGVPTARGGEWHASTVRNCCQSHA